MICRAVLVAVAVAGCADDRLDPLPNPISGCSVFELEPLITTVEFSPQAAQCPWGTTDNLDVQDGAITARVETVVRVQTPADVVVCDVQLSAQRAEQFYYDDQLIMTLNDVVLVTSMSFHERFFYSRGLRVYDWSRIAGSEHSEYEQGAYCITGSTSCELPNTQETGVFALDLSAYANELLMRRVEAESRFDLGLIITGDDNPLIDCMHTGLTLTVEAQVYDRALFDG